MLINNIDILKQTLDNKVVKDIIQEADGITIIFEDGTKLKIRTFQYQLFLN